MQKLNINRKPLTEPKKVTVGGGMYGGWDNPVGWWSVTTEGDCEGRSITQLGTFYGHVAEIAFHLADKSGYSLHFSKGEKVGVAARRVYDATKSKVSVVFNNDQNLTNILKWMDTNEVKVTKCNYYGAVTLELVG